MRLTCPRCQAVVTLPDPWNAPGFTCPHCAASVAIARADPPPSGPPADPPVEPADRPGRRPDRSAEPRRVIARRADESRSPFWFGVSATCGALAVLGTIFGVLWVIASVATTRYVEEAKKSKAQLGCHTVAVAIEQYTQSVANPGATAEERAPKNIRDLYDLPFMGPFLSQTATIDPWGKEYQLRKQTEPDGTLRFLVFTRAPDGTPISQHGIGPQARVE